jgi:CheY-like chemotaxis protein
MKKILIVDDDEFMAGVYRGILTAQGLDIEIANTGKEAIQRLEKNPPDAVLLDLMLPDIDGVKVLKHIRGLEATRNLPVIVLTNAFSGDAIKGAHREGANRVLTKATCPPRNLIKELEAVFAQAPSQTATVPTPVPGVIASAATTPPSALPPSMPASAGLFDPDQFQADLRRQIGGKLDERCLELRQLLQSMTKADPDTQLSFVNKLYRAAHALTGMAGLAGVTQLSQISSAFELLLKDIQRAPARLNPSSFRTMAQAIDVAGILSEFRDQSQAKSVLPPLILVVDDDPLARESICSALETVQLRAVSLGNPALVLELLKETTFDLAFLDVEMPGQNGFELCESIRKTDANRSTRIVFVTSHDDFERRARSTRSGGNDFISKSASPYEIAVKTLSQLLRPCHGR